MTDHVFFYAGLSLLLTHEMDAMRHHEWRILPLTAHLPSDTGYLVFTALHLPLYFWLFLALGSEGPTRERLITGLNIFFVIHVVLHLLFLRHPLNQFRSLFSWALIAGGGLCGAIDLGATAL